MTVWDELRLTLALLLEEQPGALVRWPDLNSSEGGPPPHAIGLAPWAEAVAGELSGRFGDQVDVMVGALPYPPGRPPLPRGPQRRPSPAREPAALLDPRQADVELDGLAAVRSGHTLRHGLLVRNRTGSELQIATNGQVTADVVDPQTGEQVGGFSGAQNLPLIMFRIALGGTERIPLLIGTASFTARLGYAVPPGSWGLQATLDFAHDPGEHALRRTPILPLTITALGERLIKDRGAGCGGLAKALYAGRRGPRGKTEGAGSARVGVAVGVGVAHGLGAVP